MVKLTLQNKFQAFYDFFFLRDIKWIKLLVHWALRNT